MEALVDSGATHNFISSEELKKLNLNPTTTSASNAIILADGSKSLSLGSVVIPFKFQGKDFSEQFVITCLKYPLNIGLLDTTPKSIGQEI